MGECRVVDLRHKLRQLLAAGPTPGLIVFDLDYTMWAGYIDSCAGKIQGEQSAAAASSCCVIVPGYIQMSCDERNIQLPIGVVRSDTSPSLYISPDTLHLYRPTFQI